MRAAASSIRLEVLDRVIGLPGFPGFNGSGGGALSGSELSHLSKLWLVCFLTVGESGRNSHRHGTSARLGERMLMLDASRLGTVHTRISGRHGHCSVENLRWNAVNSRGNSYFA